MANNLPPDLKKNWKQLPGNPTSVGSTLMSGVEKEERNVTATAHASNVVRNSTFQINPKKKRVKGKSTDKTYYGPWEYIQRENQEPRMRHYLYSEKELDSMDSESSKLTLSDEDALVKIKKLKDTLELNRNTLLDYEITREETKIKELITQLTHGLSKRKPAALFYDSVTNRIYDASVIDNGASLCTELKDRGFFPEGTLCKKNEENKIPNSTQPIPNGINPNPIPKNTPAGGKRKTRRMKRSLKKTKRRNKPYA